MPRRSSAAEVTVRQLAPEQAEDVHTYRPVQQLDGEPGFKMEKKWFTPEEADEWTVKAQSDPTFRQRQISLAQVRRWKNLYRTKRFVHFLPNQPICLDPDGIQLNGMHRLTALAGCDDVEDLQAGFVIIRNVPRWMFPFFDTNRVRTLKDNFYIAGTESRPQSGSIMKLAMRYEEFLTGNIRPTGWRHWALVKDEHADVLEFRQRRGEVEDWYGLAEKVNRMSKLLVPSVAVFAFYQSLAWPEGDPQVMEFIEALEEGKAVSPQHPAIVLRRWSMDAYFNREQVFAKRETNLMLLFKQFAHAQTGHRQSNMVWAYGQPMTMPYHPKGHDTAVKNVRAALDELDRESA